MKYRILLYTLSCLYNKYLVGKSYYALPYPLLTSSIHSLVNFLLSFLILKCFSPRKHYVIIPSLQQQQQQQEAESVKNEQNSKGFYRIIICGAAGGLDIGFSNSSLKYITVSFYTMIKSTVSLWAMLFAFLFHLEKPTVKHFLAIALIVIGSILTVQGETQFDPIGFTFVLTASIMSGLRWALTQVLLQKKSHHPLQTLLELSPVMFITLLCFSFILEFEADIYSITFTSQPIFNSLEQFLIFLGLSSIGGIFAFLMIYSEFLLISLTSVLTLCMIGVLKELVIIGASMFAFHDSFTVKNLVGLLMTLTGILFYQYMRLTNK